MPPLQLLKPGSALGVTPFAGKSRRPPEDVAVSRHAQAQTIEAGISQEAFDRVLLEPTRPDIPDGADILWRERDGLRLVILINPTPIEEQSSLKRFTAYKYKHGQRTPDHKEAYAGRRWRDAQAL